MIFPFMAPRVVALYYAVTDNLLQTLYQFLASLEMIFTALLFELL